MKNLVFQRIIDCLNPKNHLHFKHKRMAARGPKKCLNISVIYMKRGNGMRYSTQLFQDFDLEENVMNKNSENSLGRKISELRKKEGLTQEQLANQLGVTFQAVSKWENGASCPDISILPELARIFAVSIDELFGKEDTKVKEEMTEEERIDRSASERIDQEEQPEKELKSDPEPGMYEGEVFDDEDRDSNKDRYEKNHSKRDTSDLGGYINSVINNAMKGLDKGLRGLDSSVQIISKKVDKTMSDVGSKLKEKDFRRSYGGGENLKKFQGTYENLPWEDDETIRAVVFIGNRMVSVEEFAHMNGKMSLELSGDAKNIETYLSVTCDSVKGDIMAGGDISCDSVHGDVTAGGNVNCDNIAGDVTAGNSVNCDEIEGDVSAGNTVSAEAIHGDVTAMKVTRNS